MNRIVSLSGHSRLCACYDFKNMNKTTSIVAAMLFSLFVAGCS
jgi:hypothetical protein